MNRQDYIGASEVGALVAGCDEYGRTPLTIYLEKLGLKDRKESAVLARGNDLEPIIFEKYCKHILPEGDHLTYQPAGWDNPLVNQDYPWLGCHPDAMNGTWILEIKTVSSQIKQFNDDIVENLKLVKPSWYWQAQTQLLITGKSRVVIFPWLVNAFDWGALPQIEITPDKEAFRTIVEVTNDYYFEHLLKKVVPENTEQPPRELSVDHVETDEQLAQDIQDFATLSHQTKQLTKALDQVKDKLKKQYQDTQIKTIKAGSTVIRANWKAGASRLSKDLCTARGLDLTGCFERGKQVYTLEVIRSKDGNTD